MGPAEIGGHLRKKFFQFADARRERDWAGVKLEASVAFPSLPARERVPEVLRAALQHDVENILAGRWRAFGHLQIKVDDPPQWHCDYLAGKNLSATQSAFKLNHRDLPGGADVKLIWELSRWNQLVRLTQAAYVLNDERAAEKCVLWLEDWVKHNPPYRGWNWTSALEAGLRLIQFTWVDALLAERAEAWGFDAELDTLRYEILPAHVWFAWRHKSFGSSANNHLLGELVGLIVATARWPALAQWGASLETLHAQWEREVLAQFAEDGGNREQALNYQMFSWEFAWQARAALLAAGRKISPAVEERLAHAADFFVTVQTPTEPWDYGDSDSAFVTPFFADERSVTKEWHDWFNKSESSPAIRYWWGDAPAPPEKPACVTMATDWLVYPQSGQAVCWIDDWNLRWDLSPLGYLKTAAHGHLDALHLSLWFKELALVVDPGTGAYYGDKQLRAHLASWSAHNGPHPGGLDFPKRLGPFLWSEHHALPVVKRSDDASITAELALPGGRVERTVTRLPEKHGWQVDDNYEPATPDADTTFSVNWQFAPGWRLEQMRERIFQVTKSGVTVSIGLDAAWAQVESFIPSRETAEHPFAGELRGVCSPAFRKVAFGPALLLTARGHNPCHFRTTFLASHLS